MGKTTDDAPAQPRRRAAAANRSTVGRRKKTTAVTVTAASMAFNPSAREDNAGIPNLRRDPESARRSLIHYTEMIQLGVPMAQTDARGLMALSTLATLVS